MELERSKLLKNQVQIVINLIQDRKRNNEHSFYDTLLNRLYKIYELLKEERLRNENINGAMRAYLDTNLVKSYSDPLVIELDKLEMLLK
ncbi:hypothetical protein P4T89_09890 [Bacillus nakamurai]|uniref:IDEAL domain-containing protein n=1 Tax=Bacillus nakamurai TaxID=1793963 RepID=A0A150F2W7_9BACI|nr:hypothetical protein [Bacillus nakamurai]KXZ13089.1 hypothetical protein AXI58_05260 [Bacillus nakamurai]MED1227887.1 hypothetical protein [Bacillus nakamurai]